MLRGHLSTMYPTLFRRVPPVPWHRERLELPDGDFLDLDWFRKGHPRLVILSHGLEGHANAHYIRGMALALERRGYDALAWNCRGCSGEPNRLLRSYHSGVSDDLSAVVNHAAGSYPDISLVGFSLGGNITLKYLGELGATGKGDPSPPIPPLRGAVTFSVPCDLASSSLQLGRRQNRIYMKRFMTGLKLKIRQKAAQFPGQIDLTDLDKVKTFADFDNRYTAPLNGFLNATDYWQKASSKPFLKHIHIPTLLINALNDPFLAPPCFPSEEADRNQNFTLESPPSGGHVGFYAPGCEYSSETRAAQFLENPPSGPARENERF